METLARDGFEINTVSGPGLDVGPGFDAGRWLSERGWEAEVVEGATAVRSDGLRAEVPSHARLKLNGVAVAIHRWPPEPQKEPEAEELAAFLRLVEMTMDRVKPDILVAPGGGRLAGEILGRGHARGIATVQMIVDLNHREAAPTDFVDATLAPTRFAADYYLEAFDTPCTVLPPFVDPGRVRAEPAEQGYVTFIDPTPARGVWAFARIAEELGRRRPDIPLLVVEGRGTEADLAACGLDLRTHGNLNVMASTCDPRDYWRVTRVAVVPTLGWDGPPGAEVEALANGIPVVATDRGGLPERVGEAGVVLPLPDRATPATRTLATADEIGPWVDAIIRLWDDADSARERLSYALAESRRRADDLAACYRRFFEGVRQGSGTPSEAPASREKAVVLVPHLHGVEWECEQGLRRLEESGVKVIRRVGSSAVDAARNELASNALHDGFESMIFIDADIGFDPADALRLLARPEPVLCGVYAKKGLSGLASRFGKGVDSVLFGPDAPGPYPLSYAATGFLRIKSWVLRRMIVRLDLPLCNTKWGRGVWPFFMPMIVPHDCDRLHYLGEDWAFSHRLAQVGITPLADTSIRLWHWGRHPFGWEDAGERQARYRSYTFRIPE
jgi:glycosyltransferase involved in cell wall biosynthesis